MARFQLLIVAIYHYLAASAISIPNECFLSSTSDICCD